MSRTPPSPTRWIRQPTSAASATASCVIRVPGSKEDACQTADGKVRADAVRVDQDQRAVLNFNAPTLKPGHARPFFHGDRVGFDSHGTGTTERSPSPIALPWPMPMLTSFSLIAVLLAFRPTASCGIAQD